MGFPFADFEVSGAPKVRTLLANEVRGRASSSLSKKDKRSKTGKNRQTFGLFVPAFVFFV
jgi:hypothetical protein